MIAAQKGNISPDQARSSIYKTVQRLHGKAFFGRPTKFLTKFQESPTALQLAETIRYDANLHFQFGCPGNICTKDELTAEEVGPIIIYFEAQLCSEIATLKEVQKRKRTHNYVWRVEL